MKSRNRIKIRIRKDFFLFLLSFIFLIWYPSIIKSETILYNTSYYPAPYGGYERLMTQGDTYLARNGSSFVSWGDSALNKLKNDNGGSIELRGTNAFSSPGIIFSSGSKTSSIKETLYNSLPVLAIEEDFTLERDKESNIASVIKNVCKVKKYYEGQNTFCGGNATNSKDYVLFGAGVSNNSQSVIYDVHILWFTIHIAHGRAIAFPKTGEMLCCKFEVTK